MHGYDAILMANHGVVTYGQDLLTAFFRMETTEHFARVSLVTELLGKQDLLSSSEVQKLLAARVPLRLASSFQFRPRVSHHFGLRRHRTNHPHSPRTRSPRR